MARGAASRAGVTDYDPFRSIRRPDGRDPRRQLINPLTMREACAGVQPALVFLPQAQLLLLLMAAHRAVLHPLLKRRLASGLDQQQDSVGLLRGLLTGAFAGVERFLHS